MKDEYNNIPVYYCQDCLSLAVKEVIEGSDLDYCTQCNSTDIGQASIDEWQRLYRERYGFDYLTKEIYDNGREQRNKQTYL